MSSGDQYYPPKIHQPASYVIFKDGNQYKAQNGNTEAIDFQGTDASTVIQATVNAINATGTAAIGAPGSIFIKRLPGTASYVMTTKITGIYPGIFIYSDGANLDVTAINDTVFYFGDDARDMTTYTNRAAPTMTGLSGFRVVGAQANTSTKLVTASNISEDLFFEKLKLRYVNNGIEIRGASYMPTIRDCNSEAQTGTFIKLTALNVLGYTPDGAVIDHCETSGGSSTAGSIAVEIVESDSDVCENPYITNCWFENVETGIYSQAQWLHVSNCVLAQSAFANGVGIHIKTGTFALSGEKAMITNNYITGGSSGYCIQIEGAYLIGNIHGNILAAAAYGIYSNISEFDFSITGNVFTTVNGIHGKPTRSSITGNTFICTTNGINCSAASSYNAIVGNVFDDMTATIAGALQYSIMSDNIFTGAVSITVGGNNIIRNNRGYFTEKDGTATILSGTSSIAVNLSGLLLNINGSPSTVIVSVNTSGYGDRFYYPSNYNSGSFTIYTPNNTSANVLLSYSAKYIS